MEAVASRPTQILRRTTAFTSEILSQSDLCLKTYSTLRRNLSPSDQLSLKPLNLAVETLENAIYTSNATVQSSSLRLAQKLLASHPETAFSSFLSSLIHSLSNQPINSSLCLLQVFILDPLLARTELAPALFEDLFLVHFIPVLRLLNEQRSIVLSSDADDHPCSKLLSKMSGDQVLELKELERNYEEVMDDNCRVFAKYFKDVLAIGDGNRSIDPPELVFKRMEKDEDVEYRDDDDGNLKTKELGLKNGRYNV